MNCYFEMPFRKHAKVTLTSEHPGFIKYIFYTFNYALTDVPDDAMYFHARFNRERSTRRASTTPCSTACAVRATTTSAPTWPCAPWSAIGGARAR